jgi:membrane associated rhomboid family serine protease
MDTLVHWLNAAVSTLSAINPAWYVVLVGPLANVAQHFLKQEEGFVSKHGTLAAVLIAGASGGFLAVMQAHSVQQFLTDTGLIGSPIYVIANLLYQQVSSKIEQLNAIVPAQTVVPTPAPDGV